MERRAMVAAETAGAAALPDLLTGFAGSGIVPF